MAEHKGEVIIWKYKAEKDTTVAEETSQPKEKGDSWDRYDRWFCIFSNGKVVVGETLQTLVNKKQNLVDVKRYRKVMRNGKSYHAIKGDTKITLEKVEHHRLLELRTAENQDLSLISAINHKIRNPLTGIVSALQLLHPPKNSEQKEFLGILRKSCSNLMSVANDINDIVDLARNDITLKYQPIDLHKTLLFCTQVVKEATLAKGITLDVSFARDLPKTIYSDETRLKQIIINLLNNAINHTSKGGITIDIELFQHKDKFPLLNYVDISNHPNKVNILFKIKDTGDGMDEDSKKFVDHILGFTKENNKYLYGGFGLLISKHLCKLMMGNIWYKSEEDIGTVFYFNVVSEI